MNCLQLYYFNTAISPIDKHFVALSDEEQANHIKNESLNLPQVVLRLEK